MQCVYYSYLFISLRGWRNLNTKILELWTKLSIIYISASCWNKDKTESTETLGVYSSSVFLEKDDSLKRLTAPQVKRPTPRMPATLEGFEGIEAMADALPFTTFLATTPLSQPPSLSRC